jgi:hypothetical protein
MENTIKLTAYENNFNDLIWLVWFLRKGTNQGYSFIAGAASFKDLESK